MAVVVEWHRPKHGVAVVAALAVATAALAILQDTVFLNPAAPEAALVELVGTVLHTDTLHLLAGPLVAVAVAGPSMASLKNKMAGLLALVAGVSSQALVVLALATAVVQVALVILVVETLTQTLAPVAAGVGARLVDPQLGLLAAPAVPQSRKMETL